jgi:hypothetical protein
MLRFFRFALRDWFLLFVLFGLVLTLRTRIAEAIDATTSTAVYWVTGDNLLIDHERDQIRQRLPQRDKFSTVAASL